MRICESAQASTYSSRSRHSLSEVGKRPTEESPFPMVIQLLEYAFSEASTSTVIEAATYESCNTSNNVSTTWVFAMI